MSTNILENGKTKNRELDETPQKDKLDPFLSFLCFDIPALGFAVWAISLRDSPKTADEALLWALRGVKARMILSVIVSALAVVTAARTGEVAIGSLAGNLSALSMFLNGLCDGLSLQAMLL